MAKTALKLTATNAQTGDKITTNISDVNNNANSTQIRTLAQKLNAFTTNDYYQADAVKTINVDTEEIPNTKPEQPLSFGTITDNVSLWDRNWTTIEINFDSTITNIHDLTISVWQPSTPASQECMLYQQNNNKWYIYAITPNGGVTHTINLIAKETETHATTSITTTWKKPV